MSIHFVCESLMTDEIKLIIFILQTHFYYHQVVPATLAGCKQTQRRSQKTLTSCYVWSIMSSHQNLSAKKKAKNKTKCGNRKGEAKAARKKNQIQPKTRSASLCSHSSKDVRKNRETRRGLPSISHSTRCVVEIYVLLPKHKQDKGPS